MIFQPAVEQICQFHAQGVNRGMILEPLESVLKVSGPQIPNQDEETNYLDIIDSDFLFFFLSFSL